MIYHVPSEDEVAAGECFNCSAVFMRMPQMRMHRCVKPIVPYQCHFWPVTLAYAFWLSNQTGMRYRVFKSGICWRVEEASRRQGDTPYRAEWLAWMLQSGRRHG